MVKHLLNILGCNRKNQIDLFVELLTFICPLVLAIKRNFHAFKSILFVQAT